MTAQTARTASPVSLTLGTAQLGMQYGIANRQGKPEPAVTSEVLARARSTGHCCLDTSPAYGESESVIGGLVGNDPAFEIATKLPSLNQAMTPSPKGGLVSTISRHVQASSRRLQRDAIDYYFVHDENDYAIYGIDLSSALVDLRLSGHLRATGVSLYSPSIGIQVVQDSQIDAVQVPFNLLDHRFGRVIEAAKERNMKVFCRSVFLQGLFHMSVGDVERRLPHAAHAVATLHELASDHSVSVPDLAFRYAYHHSQADTLVLGAETPDQVQENADRRKLGPLDAAVLDAIHQIAESCAPDVVDPRLWDVKND